MSVNELMNEYMKRTIDHITKIQMYELINGNYQVIFLNEDDKVIKNFRDIKVVIGTGNPYPNCDYSECESCPYKDGCPEWSE